MKYILFLDIDGPLIPTRLHIKKGYNFYGYEYLESGLLKWDQVAIDVICKELKHVMIVFNSSHNTMGKNKMRQTAITNGFNSDMLHENIITKYPFNDDRVAAIEEWLLENIEKGTSVYWIVVDDFVLPTENCLNVSSEFGLTDDMLHTLIAKFTKDFEKHI